MKKFSKLVLLMSVGILLVSIIIGSTYAAEEKKGLKFWTYWEKSPRNMALYDVISAFNQSQKDIYVEMQYIPYQDMRKQMTIAVAGDNLPDIVQIDNPDHAAFSAMGIFSDVTKAVKKDLSVNKYFPGPLNAVKYKDRYYGLPLTFSPLALYYNVDMFKAAGLAGPPSDWNQWRAYAKKLTGNGTFGVALCGSKDEQSTFQFLPYLWMAGGDIDKMSSSQALRALNLYVNFLKDGSMSTEITNWQQRDCSAQFIGEKAAMYVDGPWRMSEVKKAKFNWSVAPLPKGPKGLADTMAGETIAAIKGKNEKAAWEVLKWTQRPDQMLKLNMERGAFPPREDVLQNADYVKNDKNMMVFSSMLKYTRPRGPNPKWPQISTAIQQMIQEVVVGAKQPEQAAKDAERIINPLLK